MVEDTEEMAHRFQGLDSWGTADVLESLWSGQSRAVAACLAVLPGLSAAVDGAVERLARTDGRLVYAGAGSSGVLAALDALELGPTFDWPTARTVTLFAGGLDLTRGFDAAAEDDAASGAERAREARLGPGDVVVGVSASGHSAFTVGVVSEARGRDALTVAVACRPDSPLGRTAAHSLVVPTGAEVIAGSTRLGAGTAQKVVLNLFSSAVMARLGHVFDNLMVDVRPENAKLRQRCVAMVARLANVDGERAAEALAHHGSVKRAVLRLGGWDDGRVDAALARAGGNLRRAMTWLRQAGEGER
ncbi:N-acetylmuramic acid 6-phosphate etherase [Corallococcus sp. M34]|uniref:N-acetylmuramic acid 6-phosphate etherase n=1 Tax=Citreicoccus inhibens TaxID=2849499 RepID=UPI001C2351F1|nr:N-acetylmuramic acid 6-phosphate etherase [Citreicoccus inhibens]MBU8900314.1 N-acetylmuramic acid 6-phosphate etherase [Citreicoccus inhibens]